MLQGFNRTKHFRKYTVILLFFIISQKSIYSAHFYDIFLLLFFFLHISNNILQDITLPDFLCTPLWKLYCPFWHQARAFPIPRPLLYYYRYYYTCEPDSRNGWQKVTWLFILLTLTRKVIPSKLHMKLLTFWKPNSRVSSHRN